MKMNDYQKRAIKTAIYPTDYRMVYPALGLAGESGEVCEKVKKYLRGDDSPNLRKDIEKELGDVLWYVANLASDLGLHLDNIATKNLDKLRDRERRDVLQGDGDER
tara:strand:- start:173 stop:490 length:318 start_codon:yes stop_codon:yes gene_type:complete